MSLIDPETIMVGAGAAKSAIDAIRGLLGAVKDAKELLPEEQQAPLEAAIEESSRQLEIAQAQIAKAFGYPLCQCEFPPTIMLTVGSSSARGKVPPGPIHECPKCGFNTSTPFTFIRTRKVFHGNAQEIED